MKEEIKDIIVGGGLGTIKFGMTRDELKGILGDPDEIDTTDEDYPKESWHYDDIELSAEFDEEDDWKLVTLAVSSPEFELERMKLIGMTKDEVMEKIKDLEFGRIKMENISEEETNQTLVSVEDSSLNLWMEDGVLSEIQWGAYYDGEDRPIWPE